MVYLFSFCSLNLLFGNSKLFAKLICHDHDEADLLSLESEGIEQVKETIPFVFQVVVVDTSHAVFHLHQLGAIWYVLSAGHFCCSVDIGLADRPEKGRCT